MFYSFIQAPTVVILFMVGNSQTELNTEKENQNTVSDTKHQWMAALQLVENKELYIAWGEIWIILVIRHFSFPNFFLSKQWLSASKISRGFLCV